MFLFSLNPIAREPLPQKKKKNAITGMKYWPKCWMKLEENKRIK